MAESVRPRPGPLTWLRHYFRHVTRVFTWVWRLVFGHKDKRRPDSPRDVFDGHSELENGTISTRSSSTIGEGREEEHSHGHGDEVESANLTVQEEDGAKDTRDGRFVLTRAEYMFLNKTDTSDEKELDRVLDLLNNEITNCTQGIVDDWTKIRQSRDLNGPSPDKKPKPSRRSPRSRRSPSPKAFLVIGEVMRERIERERSLSPPAGPPSTELEDVLELALRAWTAYCMAEYISDMFPTGPIVHWQDESTAQFIARNLAEIGQCAQASRATPTDSQIQRRNP